ncbi:bifunctional adenosylcobinamide kinase/adenosylcobinamide-phosphate guanylyltransferase [Halobacillus sp. Cin3]|uniref:bifunctional adenosylcobinamide kinase/adenosylcobinamide-phosphate guanylyltransferase n=1 Tax=Halobacillus sp. Cin3 TaxID=2928441 RepID=UPI00248EEB89|nr:bifunctional adenosylcobinamide kinase/adenosylcobinamide-phosphate guanylyltransferase [Halobacillus sp. Cin3]
MLTVVIGGVRSGKSSMAERKAVDTGEESLHYIAAGVNTDEEMQHRINHHQKSRENSLYTWVLHEHPVQPSEASFPDGSVVILDCLTTWATNEWMKMDDDDDVDDLVAAILGEIIHLNGRAGHLIVVSNDLFSDASNHPPVIEEYLQLLGTLHVKLVAMADFVYQVQFGHAQLKKGKQL